MKHAPITNKSPRIVFYVTEAQHAVCTEQAKARGLKNANAWAASKIIPPVMRIINARKGSKLAR